MSRRENRFFVSFVIKMIFKIEELLGRSFARFLSKFVVRKIKSIDLIRKTNELDFN